MKNKILLIVLIGIIITGMVVGPDYSKVNAVPEIEIEPIGRTQPSNYKQFTDTEMIPVQTMSVTSVWVK